MAPKKKQDEQRSELDIAIDANAEQIRACEAQLSAAKDALSDLQVHSVRIKQLEVELAPKEAELKSAVGAFHKLLESGASLRSRGADEGSPRSPLMRSASPTAMSNANASGVSSPGGALAGAVGGGNNSSLAPAEEAADREVVRLLQQAVKEALSGLLTPIFHAPRTAAEVAAEEARAAEAAGGSGAPSASPPPPAAAAAAAAAAAKKPGKLEPLKRDAVDYELQCPAGVDRTFFAEVLRLRQHRLALEKHVSTLQKEATASRQILSRRRDEGVTKSSQKKLEKQLSALLKAQRELMKRKEEEDLLRRRSESVVAKDKDKAKKK